MPPGPIERSTREQLKSEGILLTKWGLAQAAVKAAKLLDDCDDAGKFATLMGRLQRTLDRLADLRDPPRPPAALPEAEEQPAEERPAQDRVDELAARRGRPVS